MRWRFLLVAAALSLIVAVIAPMASAQGARERLDIRLFARVPNPGQPEPIAISPADGLVYVGTNQLEQGDEHAPSRVFVYAPRGRFVREYVIRGQQLDASHGIQGAAFDRRGLLYLLDRAARPRVIVLDPRTGRQRDYAVFRDVPRCSTADGSRDCSATERNLPAAPDYAVFAPDGSLYVTDIDQALIWRVPAGGGEPEVWFTDPRLEGAFGPNGIQFMADGRTLLFAVTVIESELLTGALYRLPVKPSGRPGQLALFWRSQPVDAPDGFALARSGNVYLALAGANQVALISPAGKELARAPSPVENLLLEVPVDGPGSAAFLGERVLVTNHSPVRGNPGSWAVLDVFAGEPGLPLHYPTIARAAESNDAERPADGAADADRDAASKGAGEPSSGSGGAGTTAGESAAPPGGGGLPDTGLGLAALIAVGALLVSAGVVLAPRRR